MFPSGRQAADNNQAWTADRRMQDCRAQRVLECWARLARGYGSLKDESKGQQPGCRGIVGGAQQ